MNSLTQRGVNTLRCHKKSCLQRKKRFMRSLKNSPFNRLMTPEVLYQVCPEESLVRCNRHSFPGPDPGKIERSYLSPTYFRRHWGFRLAFTKILAASSVYIVQNIDNLFQISTSLILEKPIWGYCTQRRN